MKKEKVVLKNETGLHARPASELTKLANTFQCNITLTAGEKVFNPKSILAVMGAGVKANTEIEIECDGEDEEKAIQALVEAFNNKFGE